MAWSEWKKFGGTLKTLEIEIPANTKIANTYTGDAVVTVNATLPTGLDENQIIVSFANID